MKKIFLNIFLFSILLIPLKNVKAITFNEIASKYKEKYDYSAIDETMGDIFNTFEDMATVTTTNNKITITTKSDNIAFTTTFNYSNNLITYKFDGKKEMTEETSMKMLTDTAYISKLLFIIAELKGYSASEILNLFNSFNEEDFTMEEQGIEITEFTIEEHTDNSNVSMSSIDTLTIDINKYLEKNTNNNPSNSNQNNPINNSNKPTTSNTENTNNNVDNPQTGYPVYLIAFLSLAILILIKSSTTKKKIKKI